MRLLCSRVELFVSSQCKHQAEYIGYEQHHRDFETDVVFRTDLSASRRSDRDPVKNGGNQQPDRTEHHHRRAHGGCGTVEPLIAVFESACENARAKYQENIAEYR